MSPEREVRLEPEVNHERGEPSARDGAASYPLNHALVVSNLTAEPPHATSRRQLDVGFSALLLSFDERFQPERVALIYDEPERELARRLESLLVSRGVDVSLWGVSMTRLDEAAHVIARSLAEWGQPLPLCVSGRHALLDSVAVSIFAAERAPILCVRHGALYRVGAQTQRTRLAPRVEVNALLTSLGGRVSRGDRGRWFEPHLSALSLSLLHTSTGELISLEVIQRLARESDHDRLISSTLRGGEVSRPGFQELLSQFESAGCLELSQGRLHFTSAAHRLYCAGGWLTIYIEAQLRRLDSPLMMLDACHGIRLELAAPHFFESDLPLTVMFGGQLSLFFCVSSTRGDLSSLLSDLGALKRCLGALVIVLSLDELAPEQRDLLKTLDLELCEGLNALKDFARWFSERFDLSR